MATARARQYERVPFFCEVALTAAGSPPLSAHSFDISLGGVGVYSETALERGTPIKVSFRLTNSRGTTVEHVAAQVAYAKADESGCRLGIEFLELPRESTHPELMRRLQSL
jgi:c-di-GMP-binding flagellar brake protein YcgR